MDAEAAALCFGLGQSQAATLATHQIQEAVHKHLKEFTDAVAIKKEVNWKTDG